MSRQWRRATRVAAVAGNRAFTFLFVERKLVLFKARVVGDDVHVHDATVRSEESCRRRRYAERERVSQRVSRR